MSGTRMARFHGMEFPVSEFRSWLDAHPGETKTMPDIRFLLLCYMCDECYFRPGTIGTATIRMPRP